MVVVEKKRILVLVLIVLSSVVVAADSNLFEGFRWFMSFPGVYLKDYKTTYVWDAQLLNPAPNLIVTSHFPMMMMAGEVVPIHVKVKNEGEKSARVLAIQVKAYALTDDGKPQRFPAMLFDDTSVPPAAHATFMYKIARSITDEPETLNLTGKIIFEIDHQLYENIFYNGSVELVAPTFEFVMKTLMWGCLGSSIFGGYMLLSFFIIGKCLMRNRKNICREPESGVQTPMQGGRRKSRGGRKKSRKD